MTPSKQESLLSHHMCAYYQYTVPHLFREQNSLEGSKTPQICGICPSSSGFKQVAYIGNLVFLSHRDTVFQLEESAEKILSSLILTLLCWCSSPPITVNLFIYYLSIYSFFISLSLWRAVDFMDLTCRKETLLEAILIVLQLFL